MRDFRLAVSSFGSLGRPPAEDKIDMFPESIAKFLPYILPRDAEISSAGNEMLVDDEVTSWLRAPASPET